MDGTIYLGSQIFDFTLPFLETLGRLGIGYSFVTNNPTRSVDDYIAKLAGFGVPCSREQMYTTTTATIGYIKANHPSAERLFLLGTHSMVSEFEQAGFVSCGDSPGDVPDLVVAAFDKTLTYSRLCRCAWWISRKDIPYIATNPDWVCPTDEDTVLVDCGSICACLEAATGRKPDVVIGKPNPEILLSAARQNGLKPEQVALVGDRLYTDVMTAVNAGSVGVLVLSGESSLQTVEESDVRPTLVCDDLSELARLLEAARS